MRIHAGGELAAAPERVWPILTDWEGQASWMPDVAWVRVLGHARELGARLEVRTRVFGISATTDHVTVTAWEPPVRIAVVHAGVVSGAGEWRLTPVRGGAATRFDWSEWLRMAPPALGEAALRMYGPWQRWMVRRSIENLSRIVDAG